MENNRAADFNIRMKFIKMVMYDGNPNPGKND